MPEYRRFISYIYRYTNGKKGRNCGYVKAEIRGNICRLQMHLERSGQERQPLKVYGFVREGAYLLGLMLGETAEKGKSCDFQTATPAQSFADTVYTTQQVCGIWLTGLENETYITIWDDEPVDLEQFVTELPRKEKHVEEEQQKEGQLTEALPIQEQNVPELAAEQACVQAEKEPDHSLAGRWHQFCYHYPAMQVFADEEICECLQIAPKDIPFLGESQWSYSQSPFVRQAAAKYHHLMVGRHKNGRFVLAIPGVYGDMQNRQLARMYGFPMFKEAVQNGMEGLEVSKQNFEDTHRETESTFGYWYHFIE